MKILACGKGFGRFSIERICLERGVDVMGFLEEHHVPSKKEEKIINIKDTHKHEFDYIVIANPNYDRYESLLIEKGIDNRKIISLVRDTEDTLRKLGDIRYLLYRNRGTTNKYKFLKLGGKFIDDVISEVDVNKQLDLVRKLINSYRKSKEVLKSFPKVYEGGYGWDYFFNTYRKDLYNAIVKNDVNKINALLNNLYRNSMGEGIIAGEKAFRTYVNLANSDATNFIKNIFCIWSNSIKRDASIDEVRLPKVGNPFGYMIGGNLVNEDTFRNHYRAEFCLNLISDIDRPIIAELGGGLGLFGYYLLKGSNNISYINFDLPENLFISSYLLSMALPNKRILIYNDAESYLTERMLASYDIILMPNFMITRIEELSVDFFINTISLSEMELPTINEYIKQIDKLCKKYFYHENLTDFDFTFTNYPTDFFCIPSSFKLLMSAISRWPQFNYFSREHVMMENLYVKRPLAALERLKIFKRYVQRKLTAFPVRLYREAKKWIS